MLAVQARLSAKQGRHYSSLGAVPGNNLELQAVDEERFTAAALFGLAGSEQGLDVLLRHQGQVLAGTAFHSKLCFDSVCKLSCYLSLQSSTRVESFSAALQATLQATLLALASTSFVLCSSVCCFHKHVLDQAAACCVACHHTFLIWQQAICRYDVALMQVW